MKIANLEMFRHMRSRSACSLARRAIATILVAAFTISSTASATGVPVSPQAGTEGTPTLGPTNGVPLGAANPKGAQASWDNLKDLDPGQEIKVVLKDLKAYQGPFQTANDEGIRVLLRTGNITFPRSVRPTFPVPRPEKANWDNVKQLFPGEEVKVELKGAKPHQGLLQTVTDEDLVLRLATGDQTFARQNILRVSIKIETHRLRNVAKGAMSVAPVGAIPVILCPTLDSTSGKTAWGDCVMLGAIVAGIGAGVGALQEALLHPKSWREVYRAR